MTITRRALIAGGLAALAAPAAAANPQFYGLNVGTELSRSELAPKLLALYYQAGVRWLRVWYNWASLEPQPGVYDFAGVRAALDVARRAGMRVLFVIWGTPAHAGDGRLAAMPDLRALSEYCKQLRVQLAGSVDAWEVGNEPNLKKYFIGSAERYVATLAAARVALAGSGPVVAAGPSGSAGLDYWLALAEAGLEDHCDFANLHPYRAKAAQVLTLVDRFQQVVRKPLWITELGLSDRLGEQAKAHFLSTTLSKLGGRAERVFWYRGLQGKGLHALRYGLVEVEGPGLIRPLPAYTAYEDLTRSREQRR